MGRGDKTTSIDVNEVQLRGGSSPEDSGEVGASERPAEASDTGSSSTAQALVSHQANLPAAFDLIAEACAAVKIAEDRVRYAEDALEDATGQIEDLTERLGAADRRAEMAERHAARAEERLRVFCQTILTTMHGVE